MTLRRRLLLALVTTLTALALVLVAAVWAMRSYLVAQVDARLGTLAADGKQVVALAERAAGGTTGPATALVSDFWVGIRDPGGRVVTVLAPSGDPALTPLLDGNEPLGEAVTRSSTGGQTHSVRVVSAALGDKRRIVLALSLTDADATTANLACFLGLAWVIVAVAASAVALWADRFGLRPLARMTAVARTVTAQTKAGHAAEVEVAAERPGTEASALAEAFDGMLGAVNESAARQREFVADASHELRTPLTTLRGYSALYVAGALRTDAEVGDAMRRINAEATRMAALVDSMLDLTSLDAGQPLTWTVAEVGPLLAGVASDLRAAAPDRQVVVEAPAALHVRADAGRLAQALLALGTNAVQHGSGRVTLRAREVAMPGRSVRFEVSDEGAGVPTEQREAVFARFHRAGPALSGGHGLGLPIVTAIVRAHGGRRGVAPTPESTFWIELPQGTGADNPGPEVPTTRQGEALPGPKQASSPT